MSLKLISPTQEELGRRRFPNGAEFLRVIQDSSDRIRQRLLQSLASNYPKVPETNLGVLYTALAEEFARLSYSLSEINEDRFHISTRPEYLFQILGDYLFLAQKAINPALSGEEYRSFLITIRNAYFKGSRKKNIEDTVSTILGINVILKELFLEARKPDTIYTIKDTHKLIFNIFMDQVVPPENVGDLIPDLNFFIDLIKPAHVLYNTRFIWTDDYTTNKRKSLSFGRDENGVTPKYDYAVSSEVILYLVKASLYTGSGSSVVEDTWDTGTIAHIDTSERVITLTNGKKLIFGEGTLFYDHDSQGDFRVEVTDLSVSDVLKYLGLLAPGPFKFYNTPPEVLTGIYKQFDPEVIDTPYFQENVKKVYDLKGRFEQTVKETNYTIESTKVTDTLVPNYEDVRDYCDLPAINPVSDIFYTVNLLPIQDTSFLHNLPANVIVTTDSNIFQLTNTPVLNESGALAGPNDILLFVNGMQIFNGVQSINDLTGELSLNFLVPSNSTVQVNYWFSKRFPVLTDFIYTWPTDSDPGTGGNIPASTTIIETGQIVKILKWPFIITDPTLYGDSTDYQVDRFPILNILGNLAVPSDLTVFVNGLEVPGSVSFVRPLLGHVGLTFIPPQGAVVKIQYYFTNQNRTYVFVPDNIGYPSDAVFGNRSSYTTIVDENPPGGLLEHVFADESILEIGYRWRAFDLSASAILNSEDTLVLNGSTKNFNKATLKNSPNRLNLAKVVFSPEYIKDTSKSVVLNDSYLDNNLPANLVLHKGIPPFIKTFTDTGKYTLSSPIVPSESSFSGSGPNYFDIQCSVSVLALNDESGLIDYSSLSNFRENKKIARYSALRLVSENDDGIDVSLSSICEDRNLDIQVGVAEVYFPSRELRTNNYLDYNRFVPTVLVSGNAKFLNGSKIIKSVDENWSAVTVGAILSIPSLEQTFTIINAYNQNTLSLNTNFTDSSGVYGYTISVEPTSDPEVELNKVTRSICIDTSGFYDYNFIVVDNDELLVTPGQVNLGAGSSEFNLVGSLSVESAFVFCTDFPDPDPDPTPINPGDSPVYPVDDPTSSDYRKRNASKLYRQDGILDFSQVHYTITGPTVTQSNPIGSFSNPGTPGISSTGPTNRSWDEFKQKQNGNLQAIPMLFGTVDSESLYRVRWRNWDQDLITVGTGIIEENNISIMDDLGEGIKRFYWNVSTQQLQEYNFFGSIIETSSLTSSSVLATSHPDGLVLIENPDDLINPTASGLNATNYELRETILRELLHDNSFQITIIEEFVRL